MTDHDLATLLRDHVSDEPPYHQTTAAVLSRGRRRVRRTRLAAVASGVAALALGAGAIAPQVLGGGTDDDRAVDEAIAEAVRTYDVTTMPRTMDEHARSVLAASVPDLGPADFVAFDSQYQELPERYWEMASGLTLRYGPDSPHRISVTLQHARSYAEGDADRYCIEGLEGGYYLECAVDRTDDGDVVVTTLTAMRPMPGSSGRQGWNDQFMVVTDGELGSVRSDQLWFSQEVKVIKSETFVTFVSELVQAPDAATARERLVVPTDDLATIGLDPALAMPKPPPGENGCPQWTMPTMNVSCSRTN